MYVLHVVAALVVAARAVHAIPLVGAGPRARRLEGSTVGNHTARGPVVLVVPAVTGCSRVSFTTRKIILSTLMATTYAGPGGAAHRVLASDNKEANGSDSLVET